MTTLLLKIDFTLILNVFLKMFIKQELCVTGGSNFICDYKMVVNDDTKKKIKVGTFFLPK